jgi:hypothetical protein
MKHRDYIHYIQGVVFFLLFCTLHLLLHIMSFLSMEALRSSHLHSDTFYILFCNYSGLSSLNI